MHTFIHSTLAQPSSHMNILLSEEDRTFKKKKKSLCDILKLTNWKIK